MADVIGFNVLLEMDNQHLVICASVQVWTVVTPCAIEAPINNLNENT